MDDTARAPMAKAILQSKELPWPMEIGSRGLVVLFPQPVNQKVEAVLARNGLSAKDHTTTPLTAEDINDDTLLLVMEDSQREKIRGLPGCAPSADDRRISAAGRRHPRPLRGTAYRIRKML